MKYNISNIYIQYEVKVKVLHKNEIKLMEERKQKKTEQKQNKTKQNKTKQNKTKKWKKEKMKEDKSTLPVSTKQINQAGEKIANTIAIKYFCKGNFTKR